jgi:indolepyruvate ferredoxin oxidoreductase alpha subunit
MELLTKGNNRHILGDCLFNSMGSKGALLLSGNEAIAHAALEAGIRVASAYPGTPSTEILECLASNSYGRFHTEWAVNEKIALETAAGASYAKARSICCMKHVGLNVALDPLMSLAYTGVRGGLLVVVADDPGIHSSQSEQDSRHLIRAAKLLGFEPKDSQEAHDMAFEAFHASEALQLPIVMRSMTRLSHTSSPVVLRTKEKPKPIGFEKDPFRYVLLPSVSRQRHKWLIKKQQDIREYVESSKFNRLESSGREKVGVVACGTGYNLAMEYASGCAILKIGTWPIPQKMLAKLVSQVERIIVLEQGDPIVEEHVRAAHKNVQGKLSGHLPQDGELSAETVAPLFSTQKGQPIAKKEPILPTRPLLFCPGCPHMATYHVLRLLKADAVAGDIGCYALGGQRQVSAIDTILCMGASISKAAGMSQSGLKGVYAVIGDSTFLHSGTAALMSAAYNGARFTLVILDNHNTAMTGHQPTVLSGIRADGTMGKAPDLEAICRSCGATEVIRYDAKSVRDAKKAFKAVQPGNGVRVLIADGHCTMQNGVVRSKPLSIDTSLCVMCGLCGQLGCAAVINHQGKPPVINRDWCTGCTICAQVCQKKAIR